MDVQRCVRGIPHEFHEGQPPTRRDRSVEDVVLQPPMSGSTGRPDRGDDAGNRAGRDTSTHRSSVEP